MGSQRWGSQKRNTYATFFLRLPPLSTHMDFLNTKTNLGRLWEGFWEQHGRLWEALKRFSGSFESLWRHFGRLWGDFGNLWGCFGELWESFGSVWEKDRWGSKKREGRRNTKEARREKEAPTRKEEKTKNTYTNSRSTAFGGPILLY